MAGTRRAESVASASWLTASRVGGATPSRRLFWCSIMPLCDVIVMNLYPYMDLIKKTTILFPPDLYEQLARLARQRETSVGELVRTACRTQYRIASRETRLAAVRELAGMSLPAGSPEEMEAESVPSVEPLP